MTIHSDWPRVLREECPEAFSPRPPKSASRIGFVDGHLQLMRLHPCIGTWSNFVRCQFVKPLQMLLERGCPRVVLCFDCYDNVPEYKNMTQTRRVGAHSVRPFSTDQVSAYANRQKCGVGVVWGWWDLEWDIRGASDGLRGAFE